MQTAKSFLSRRCRCIYLVAGLVVVWRRTGIELDTRSIYGTCIGQTRSSVWMDAAEPNRTTSAFQAKRRGTFILGFQLKK